MTLNTLKDVYIDQLQDLYSANKQAHKVTLKLHEASTNSELRDALDRSAKGIERGIDQVGGILKAHDADPDGEFCKGMEGLVKEAHAHVLDADFSDDDVRDAMIITQAQRMTHYALAGYGCVSAFANRLELKDDRTTLQNCLDHTYSGDRELSQIAEGGVNASAAA